MITRPRSYCTTIGAVAVAWITLSVFAVPAKYTLAPRSDGVDYGYGGVFYQTPPTDVQEKVRSNFHDRVAVNALRLLGAVEFQPGSTPTSGNEFGLSRHGDWQVSRCIGKILSQPSLGKKLDDQEKKDIFGYVVAILAVENMNRPPLQRTIKAAAARAWITLFGTAPSLSLGTGQVKPVRLEQIIHDPLWSDAAVPPEPAAILSYLLDDCTNAGAVTMIVVTDYIRDKEASTDTDHYQVLRRTAGRYNGAHRSSPSPFDYATIVNEAALLFNEAALLD
jgi:hypothetical protein